MSEVKRILIPLDLSPLGEAKLPVAEAQARAFGAELILLHVLPPEAVDRSGAVSPEANWRHIIAEIVLGEPAQTEIGRTWGSSPGGGEFIGSRFVE